MRLGALGLGAFLLLAACGPAPVDDVAPSAEIAGEDFGAVVAELAADRGRLVEAQAFCREKPVEAPAMLCSAAAEATRKRFRTTANPYTHDQVDRKRVV